MVKEMTEANLRSAYAGESQAHMRYLIYMEMAEKEGLVKDSKTICYFVPVVVVQKNNPAGIKTISDLAGAGLRIGQGDQKAAAVGRITSRLLDLNGVDLAAWKKNVVMQTPTVNELGIAIKLKTVDAVIVWDAIAAKYSDVSEVIEIDPKKNVCPAVGAAVLTVSKNQDLAGKFLEFMTSSEGRDILSSNGYTVDDPKSRE